MGRENLREKAGQLFDPTGLVTPTALPAKLLIQNAWRYQQGWDEPLPACLGEKMSSYCQNQRRLRQLEIPRHFGGNLGCRKASDLYGL